MTRGDVVIVQFPYAGGGQGKNRPALVVQNDRDNRRLSNTVVAMISGNTQHAAEPTQVLVDPNIPAGASSRLHGPSVVKCCNLVTIRQQDVFKTIGRLSDRCSRKWTRR
ncbi:MAG: type II toxin-antitoxin system PemK/MazF family toxin [Pirellulales bacterium]